MSYRNFEITVDAERLTARPADWGPLLVFPTTVRIRATIKNQSGAINLTGKTVKIMARDPAALNTGANLFEVAATADADWTDLADGKVSFVVDTNTAAMLAFLGTSERKDLHLYIEQTTDGIPLAAVPDQLIRQTAAVTTTTTTTT